MKGCLFKAETRDVGLSGAFQQGAGGLSRGGVRSRSACRRWVRPAEVLALVGLCNLVVGCSEKPQISQTPISWTAEVNRERPIVTASLDDASQTKMLPDSRSESSQSLVPKARVDRRHKLRKGGGYHKIGKRYQVAGIWYTPKHDADYEETGVASWYGDKFHAQKTANGEIYDMNALTAAHRTLPLPSLVRVTYLANGRSVVVRVNDRGPFKKGRIIDVSARVARELGFADKGTAKVRVKYLGPAPLDGGDEREQASLMTTRKP